MTLDVCSPQCPHEPSNLLHASIFCALLTNTLTGAAFAAGSPRLVGCSLPGVSAMPSPFPLQVWTPNPPLVSSPKAAPARSRGAARRWQRCCCCSWSRGVSRAPGAASRAGAAAPGGSRRWSRAGDAAEPGLPLGGLGVFTARAGRAGLKGTSYLSNISNNPLFPRGRRVSCRN